MSREENGERKKERKNERKKKENRVNQEGEEFVAIIEDMPKEFLENDKTKLRVKNSLAQQLYVRENNLNAYDLKMIFSLYCGFTKNDKIEDVRTNGCAIVRKYRIKDLLDLYNLTPSGSNYKRIKASLKKLLTTAIEYKNSDGSTTTVCWIKEFNRTEDDSSYEIEISKGTMTHFMDFMKGTGFLETAIAEVLKLKNAETISLLLNILTFEKTGKRIIEIDEAKKIMGFKNTEGLKHFTPKVRAALKEIKERTSYEFKLTLIKNGKNITHLEFKIAQSPNKQKKENKYLKEIKEMRKCLSNFGYTEAEIDEEIEKHCKKRNIKFNKIANSRENES